VRYERTGGGGGGGGGDTPPPPPRPSMALTRCGLHCVSQDFSQGANEITSLTSLACGVAVDGQRAIDRSAAPGSPFRRSFQSVGSAAAPVETASRSVVAVLYRRSLFGIR
jgi:hypothetical protein